MVATMRQVYCTNLLLTTPNVSFRGIKEELAVMFVKRMIFIELQ
jgi:hypothetical protein